MRKTMHRLSGDLLLLLMGGMGYFILELVWRGWSHPTMVAVGGFCFLGICKINGRLSWDTPLWLQALLCAALITATEFASGCVINLWLHLGVWDYSGNRGNLLGQVCPLYAALWYLLAFPTILADDLIRWRMGGEEKPRYRWRTGQSPVRRGTPLIPEEGARHTA